MVTVIVGLLAGIATPQVNEVRTKAFNATLLSDIRTTVTEIERYALTKYSFPSDEDALFDEGLRLSPGVFFTKFTVSNAGDLAIAEVQTFPQPTETRLSAFHCSVAHSRMSSRPWVVFRTASPAAPARSSSADVRASPRRP